LSTAGEENLGAAGREDLGAAGEEDVGAAGEEDLGAAGGEVLGAAGEEDVGAAGEEGLGAAREEDLGAPRHGTAPRVPAVLVALFEDDVSVRHTSVEGVAMNDLAGRQVPDVQLQVNTRDIPFESSDIFYSNVTENSCRGDRRHGSRTND
jgi:hypothetical protein